MTELTFIDLGLAEPVQRALESLDHITPSPIQAQAIPQLLEGRDVLGIAQTGTGKTAAFALPILHQLSKTPGKNGPLSPRALILAPTRELATQIGESCRAYGKHLHLRQTVVFGGVSQYMQVKALSRGVEILIATPGRLLDLLNQKRLSLEAVEYFVIDEADRMMDMGFINDVRKIVKKTPRNRQSLLFSATMAQEIQKLCSEFLSDPVRIEITPQATPVDRIEQSVYHLDSGAKRDVLNTFLENPELSKVIVFSRTKRRADRIVTQLEQSGVAADAIHGDKSQGARQRALKSFRSGKVRVLVATDIAARGIDIDGVTHVINYELPNEPDSYVHRIGRTGRAGARGVAISFCDSTERGYLYGIEKLIKHELTVIGEAPMEDEYALPPKSNPGRSRNKARAHRMRPKKGANQNKARRSSRKSTPQRGGKPRKTAHRKKRATQG